MAHALKLDRRTQDATARPSLGAILYEVLRALSCPWSLETIREPDGLQYPLSARAKRLMRNARTGG